MQEKIKVMKKQIPNSSNSFLFRKSYIHSKIPADYPQNPWGFITIPIPIPYPYPWESPWESPYPRQPWRPNKQWKRWQQRTVAFVVGWRQYVARCTLSVTLASSILSLTAASTVCVTSCKQTHNRCSSSVILTSVIRVSQCQPALISVYWFHAAVKMT